MNRSWQLLFGCDCGTEVVSRAACRESPAEEVPRRPSPMRDFLLAMIVLSAVAWLVPDFGVADVLGISAWLGVLPLLAGLGLMLWANSQFRAAGTPVKPFAQPVVLVTGGAYEWSRNPMYLGMLLMLAGLAIILASPVALTLIWPVKMRLEHTYVLPEEWRLHSQLGRVWHAYRQRVARWVSLPMG